MSTFRIVFVTALSLLVTAGCSPLGTSEPKLFVVPDAIERIDNSARALFPFQNTTRGVMPAAAVPLSTIARDKLMGCSGLDCIPQYSYPQITPASEAGWLAESDLVLGTVINGHARAYPLSTLWTHEIANDTLGGVRMSINYCPLTGTGMNFKGTLDGKAITFGVSGFLYNNNLILYDHQSRSFWPQMLFTAAWGEHEGKMLDLLPVYEMTWGAWKALFPGTTVVSENYHTSRYPYGSYPTNHDYILFAQTVDPRLKSKDLVLGVIGPHSAKAYPFANMGENAVVNDAVDSEAIVVVFDKAAEAAAAYQRPMLDNNEPVEFESSARSAGEPTGLKAVNSDAIWNFAGIGVAGDAIGNNLVPVTTAFKGYWLSWGAYYDIMEIYGN